MARYWRGAFALIGARCSLHGRDRASVTSSFISLQMEKIRAQCSLSANSEDAFALLQLGGYFCRSGCRGEQLGRIPGRNGPALLQFGLLGYKGTSLIPLDFGVMWTVVCAGWTGIISGQPFSGLNRDVQVLILSDGVLQ